MNKVYIIFPILGLLIFAGIYTSFSKTHDEKIAQARAKTEADRKEKARKRIVDQESAIKAAVEAQARNRLKKEEKERADEAKRVARQEAEDRRQRTFDEQNRNRDQVSRLKKDLAEIKEETEKIAKEKENHVNEGVFLKTYVKQAEGNVKYYYDLLEKISAAEKAAAEAAAAAAAAAKKS